MVNLNQEPSKLAKILIRRQNLIALLQEGVEFLKGNNTSLMITTAEADATAIKAELEKRAANFDKFLQPRDINLLRHRGTPAPLSFTGGKPKAARQ